MKKIFLSLLVTVGLIAFTGCGSDNVSDNETNSNMSNTSSKSSKIDNSVDNNSGVHENEVDFIDDEDEMEPVDNENGIEPEFYIDVDE